MEELVIEPLFDNVLLLPEPPETQTKKGIYLPSESGDNPKIAEVIAVGDGKELPIITSDDKDKDGNRTLARTTMKVKVGDKVLYKPWGTNSVKMNKTEYYLIPQENILGIVRNKSEII